VPEALVERLAEVLDLALDRTEPALRVGWSKSRRRTSIRTEIRKCWRAYEDPFVVLWSRDWNARLDIGLFGDRTIPELGVRLSVTRWFPLPYGKMARLARTNAPRGWRGVPCSDARSAALEVSAPLPATVSDAVELLVTWLTELDRADLLVNIDRLGREVADPGGWRFADHPHRGRAPRSA
jgi:hypothetical protein